MFNKLESRKKISVEKSPLSSQEIETLIQRDDIFDKFHFPKIFSCVNRLSLRTKSIIYSLTISTVPILSIGAAAYYFANQSLTKEVYRTKQTSASLIADNIYRFMQERQADIQVISQFSILVNPRLKKIASRQEIEARLNGYKNTYNIYESIAVLDLSGNVEFQTHGKTFTNQKSKDYFQAALKTQKTYISQPIGDKIYIANVVKDNDTNKVINIVVATMPITSLETAFKIPKFSLDKYYLVDEKNNNILLAKDKKTVGVNIKKELLGIEKLPVVEYISTNILSNRNTQKLVTSVPQSRLTIEPNIRWKLFLTTDKEIAFANTNKFLIALAIGTGATAILVGALATILTNQVVVRILAATMALRKLARGNLNTRLSIKGDDELGALGTNINLMAEQLQELQQKQSAEAEQLKIFNNILISIRESLNSEELLDTTVKEARLALAADRVIIYHFNARGIGQVIAESVAVGLPISLGQIISDSVIRQKLIEVTNNSNYFVTNNIYEADLASELLYWMERLQNKSILVTPIYQNRQIFGFLIASSGLTYRAWQNYEINFFTQLSVQVGLTLERIHLVEKSELAREIAENISEEQRQEKEQLQTLLFSLLKQIEGASQGDLTVRAEVVNGEIGTVADFFNLIIENLREIVIKVKESAIEVNRAIAKNSGSISQLAISALKQAEEIEYTLGTIDKMRLSIKTVAKSARQASVVARTASRTAETSRIAMDLTVENILCLRDTINETAQKVKRLGESSGEISRVVSLINQIALQTNLLAINAGIEAARAGDEGHGFAVVAEEVAVLAARSASATGEIEAIVAKIQLETSEVVKAMEIGTKQVVEGSCLVEDSKISLMQIIEVCYQIDSLVQSITQATVSQVQTSKEVADVMKDFAKISEITSHSSRQVATSLQKTIEISQQLQESVENFYVG